DGRIIRSTLDGKRITFLVEGLQHPSSLVLDTRRSQMYWLEGIDKSTLKTADLNGKGVKSLAVGLNHCTALSLDRDRGALYYWEEPGRVICMKTDGTREEELLNAKQHPSLQKSLRGLLSNPTDNKLYWMSTSGKLSRMAV